MADSEGIRASAAELLHNPDVIQVVFTARRAKYPRWCLNRIESHGEFRGWELFDARDWHGPQYALMSTDKTLRVIAKHFPEMAAVGFTREDFKR